MHAMPGAAASLGRASGEARRKAAEEARNNSMLTFAAPKNPEDLKSILAQSIADVASGQMNDRTARAIAGLGGALLRTFEMTNMAAELKKLQDMLVERESGICRRDQSAPKTNA